MRTVALLARDKVSSSSVTRFAVTTAERTELAPVQVHEVRADLAAQLLPDAFAAEPALQAIFPLK